MGITGVGSSYNFVYNTKTGKLSTKDGSKNEFVDFCNGDVKGEDTETLNHFGAYSQQRCKHQYYCAVDCILQILFSSYLISPYHSINYQLQKSEAFQSVHHVSFILCYIVLYNFLSLIFSLIRDRKLVWEDIT